MIDPTNTYINKILNTESFKELKKLRDEAAKDEKVSLHKFGYILRAAGQREDELNES